MIIDDPNVFKALTTEAIERRESGQYMGVAWFLPGHCIPQVYKSIDRKCLIARNLSYIISVHETGSVYSIMRNFSTRMLAYSVPTYGKTSQLIDKSDYSVGNAGYCFLGKESSESDQMQSRPGSENHAYHTRRPEVVV